VHRRKQQDMSELSALSSLLVGLSATDAFVAGVASERCKVDAKLVIALLNKLKLRKGVNREQVIAFLLRGDFAKADQLLAPTANTFNPAVLNHKPATKRVSTKDAKASTAPAKATTKSLLSTSPVMSPRKVSKSVAAELGEDKFDLLGAADAESVDGETVSDAVEVFSCSLCDRSFDSLVKLTKHIEFSTMHQLNLAPPLPTAGSSGIPMLPKPVQSKVEANLIATRETSFFVSAVQDVVTFLVHVYEMPSLLAYVVRGTPVSQNAIDSFPSSELYADSDAVARIVNKKDNDVAIIMKRLRVNANGELAFIVSGADNVDISIAAPEAVRRAAEVSLPNPVYGESIPSADYYSSALTADLEEIAAAKSSALQHNMSASLLMNNIGA